MTTQASLFALDAPIETTPVVTYTNQRGELVEVDTLSDIAESRLDARYPGWARLNGKEGGSYNKLDTTYQHVATGWVVQHCGHPTANYPYLVLDRDGGSWGAPNFAGYKTLAVAMAAVSVHCGVAPTCSKLGRHSDAWADHCRWYGEHGEERDTRPLAWNSNPPRPWGAQ